MPIDVNEDPQKRDELRYSLLKVIFNTAKGDTSPYMSFPFDDPSAHIEEISALRWLCAEGLIEVTGSSYTYSLTHRGIKEYEDSIRQPPKRTEHFSINVVINVNSKVGSIQQGSDNTSN